MWAAQVRGMQAGVGYEATRAWAALGRRISWHWQEQVHEGKGQEDKRMSAGHSTLPLQSGCAKRLTRSRVTQMPARCTPNHCHNRAWWTDTCPRSASERIECRRRRTEDGARRTEERRTYQGRGVGGGGGAVCGRKQLCAPKLPALPTMPRADGRPDGEWWRLSRSDEGTEHLDDECKCGVRSQLGQPACAQAKDVKMWRRRDAIVLCLLCSIPETSFNSRFRGRAVLQRAPASMWLKAWLRAG